MTLHLIQNEIFLPHLMERMLVMEWGGTLKRLAAHESFQRAKEKQILTKRQLYEFASEEIPGITSFLCVQ